jgi:hypothetical protein
MTRAWKRVVSLSVILGAGSLLFAAVLSQRIQSQRAEAIRDGCLEQNARHDGTIKTLDRLIAAAPPGPERVRAIHNRAGTVLLIEQLAPKKDCAELVRKSTTG